MSDVHDSDVSDSSKTNHESVAIHVDDLSNEKEPVNKDTSETPSIESDTVDHISVPRPDDNHSSSSSIAQSTTVLDVDDGAGAVVKKTVHKTYKKITDNIFLGIAITIVCGTILTPVILFYTRPDISNPFEATTMQTSCQKVSSN